MIQELEILDLVDDYLLFRNQLQSRLKNGFIGLAEARKTTEISCIMYPLNLNNKDAIKWFSGMPNLSLRNSQLEFKKALELIVELADIDQKLYEKISHL